MHLQSGGGRYNVQTGRRDGLVSLAKNVSLSGPSTTVSQAIAAFAAKGLTATDMVLLLGTQFPTNSNHTFVNYMPILLILSFEFC